MPTFPSRFPLLPLDRIWFSAPLELATIATLTEAGRLSDHLPLLASFSWIAGWQRGSDRDIVGPIEKT
jgi:endonuclease/exonuclease/phosphatase family metal-dependent hydrolase